MRRVLMVVGLLTVLAVAGATAGLVMVSSADAQACPASNPNCKR